MIEIRQAKDNLPGHSLLDSFGHTSGLLCRTHAQHLTRRRSATEIGRNSGSAQAMMCRWWSDSTAA
jgi:hypothetical protein